MYIYNVYIIGRSICVSVYIYIYTRSCIYYIYAVYARKFSLQFATFRHPQISPASGKILGPQALPNVPSPKSFCIWYLAYLEPSLWIKSIENRNCMAWFRGGLIWCSFRALQYVQGFTWRTTATDENVFLQGWKFGPHPCSFPLRKWLITVNGCFIYIYVYTYIHRCISYIMGNPSWGHTTETRVLMPHPSRIPWPVVMGDLTNKSGDLSHNVGR